MTDTLLNLLPQLQVFIYIETQCDYEYQTVTVLKKKKRVTKHPLHPAILFKHFLNKVSKTKARLKFQTDFQSKMTIGSSLQSSC